MDLGLEIDGPDVHLAATALILLDTNALIWLHRGDARVATLVERGTRLHVSPASLLELQFLLEGGRVRLRGGGSITQIAADERWVLDDPPSAAWFETAIGVGWTRDPFDRLLVAHARLRKWRLATGDRGLIEHLASNEYVEL
jgi:PIN domain nuclease of toxin-antitoxin system